MSHAEDQREPTPSARSAEATSLAEKVVLVTGGARGLGAAICRAVTAEGAHARRHRL